MYHHLLVPVDDTPLAALLVNEAIALARDGGARLTILHVEVDDSGGTDAALLHALSPSLYARHAAGRSPIVLARAAAAARAASVAHQTLAVRALQPHEAILDTARAQGCDLVVLASHGRRGLQAMRLGSVTRKVLQQATLPVLVVAVESNLTMSDEQQAMAIIRAEHRSLAAVIHGLQHVWRRASDAGRPPDYALVRAMLFYIAEFPEKLHHPKEDDHLFLRLRARTRTLDAVIDRLQAQHADGAARFAALRTVLDGAERGDTDAANAFDTTLEVFAQTQWAHMATEEREILPAAGEYLSAEDWSAIVQAFGENGDPRFGSDESFEQLFDRLLRLAAAGT